jgi:hypothetical protein
LRHAKPRANPEFRAGVQAITQRQGAKPYSNAVAAGKDDIMAALP